jgi:hypothetical protein
MYDDICKFIGENFSKDLAQWLLGESLLDFASIADLINWLNNFSNQ